MTGYGLEAGEPLSKHPLVDKVAFTGKLLVPPSSPTILLLHLHEGSVATGCRVMEAASADVKRVTLELGGKSPMIVFEVIYMK